MRRFESSFGSFEQSLKNLKKNNENVLEFVKKTNKYILDRDFIEKIHILEPEDIENELIKRIEGLNSDNNNKKNAKIYYLDDFDKKDEFLSDIQSDISLFDDILDELKKLKLVGEDPKSKTLIKNIKKQLQDEPNRKIVIFTEYIDTVKHLSERLNSAFNGRVLSIAGDMKSKIDDINKNFDATYKNKKIDMISYYVLINYPKVLI